MLFPWPCWFSTKRRGTATREGRETTSFGEHHHPAFSPQIKSGLSFPYPHAPRHLRPLLLPPPASIPVSSARPSVLVVLIPTPTLARPTTRTDLFPLKTEFHQGLYYSKEGVPTPRQSGGCCTIS